MITDENDISNYKKLYLIDTESIKETPNEDNKLNHYDLIKVWTGR
jgi:hypothetical protein